MSARQNLSDPPLTLGAEGGFVPGDSCRQLWAAVLLLAVRDFARLGDLPEATKAAYENEAALWFASESTAVGSFIFVCDILDLPFYRVRDQVLDHAKSFTVADLSRFADRGNFDGSALTRKTA